MIEKRQNPTMTDQEMYEISDINSFIEDEQRKDELERLYGIKEQKRVWRSVVFSCLILNLVLATFAIIGYLQNA